MSDLLYPFIVVAILIVWFETHAFVEYCRALKFGVKFFKIDQYKEWQDRGLSYPDFLTVKDNTFFNRLIACAICLNVWLNLFFVFAHKSIYIFFGGFYLSLLMYFLLKLIIVKGDSE